jgi:hypothetical protein
MKLPFTAEQFFDTFARYNVAVWPAQPVLFVIALLAVALALFAPQRFARLPGAVLALLWVWLALGYHFAFFTRINRAAWLFGTVSLAGAAAFAWYGVVRAQLRIEWRAGLRHAMGVMFLLYAGVGYPLIGIALRHHYPAAPTFGLPCPTTLFTIGVLLLSTAPVPRAIVVVPLLWSMIGSYAAVGLGVQQDFALVAAAAASMWLLLRSDRQALIEVNAWADQGGRLFRWTRHRSSLKHCISRCSS